MRLRILPLVALLSGCTNVFYQPTRIDYFDPKDAKPPLSYQDHYFESPDGTQLHAWFFPAEGVSKGTVVQFHGNAENLTSHFVSAVWLVREGYNLFAFDYRGYGKSGSVPYPEGIRRDALAALEKAWDLDGRRPKSLVVYGQSLGGAIALKAVGQWGHREAIRSVVVESSFVSYKQEGMDVLSHFWLTWPLQWMSYLLVTDHFSPRDEIPKLAPIPLLVMHGRKDRIVAFARGREIYDLARDPKYFLDAPEAGHIQLMTTEKGKYRKSLLTFLESGACPGVPDRQVRSEMEGTV